MEQVALSQATDGQEVNMRAAGWIILGHNMLLIKEVEYEKPELTLSQSRKLLPNL